MLDWWTQKRRKTILNICTILKRRLWKRYTRSANLDWCNKRSRLMKSAAKAKILSQLGWGTPNFFLGRNGWKQPKLQYQKSILVIFVWAWGSMRELGIVPWSRLRYFSEGSTDEMGNGISRERKGIELRISRLQFPLDLWRLLSVPNTKKRSITPFGD